MLVFGPLRERVGVSEVHVDGATVQDVWDELVRRHPAAAADAASVRAARNLGYCSWGTAVESGDTIAFIPPVAGGRDDASPVRVWITDVPIDIGSVIASAGTTRDGAVATFIGRVRDHNDGVAVHRLDYEAYAEMAEAEMRRIGEELFARGGISTITIVHRTGSLLIGDASVVVVVAASHRDTAFPACQEALELIKSTVPVWKREHTDDGAHWVDARHGVARRHAVTQRRLTHVDDSGRAHMVDISEKAVTRRSATARGRVDCTAEAVQLIADGAIAKGSVLETARLAGIMGAKRTSDLIPLCHPLQVRHVDVDLTLDSSATPGVVIEATARVEGATGVEMEALTAVAIAGLTVIDMIKAIDHWASITDVTLVHKEGGRSGSLDRPGAR